MSMARLTAALVFVLASVATAQQDTAETRLSALMKRIETSELGYVEKYRAFRDEVEAFARKHEGSEAAVEAHLWLLQQTWWLRREGKMESTAGPILEHLLKTYPKSPKLRMIAEYAYVLPRDEVLGVFERIAKASPHDEVKAAMLFGRAQRLEGDERRAALLEVKERYAELPWRATTYGRIADAVLNPHPAEALKPGEIAPDIVGEDVDGTPMKLSDYRGKVVVLDFWGDW